MPEEEKTETVPMQTMPALALRGLTVYPKMMVHFDVGREASVKAIEESMSSNQPIFLVAQKDIRVEEPDRNHLFAMGTVSVVRQILRLPGKTIRVMVEGQTRARLHELTQTDPYLVAQVEPVETSEHYEGKTNSLRAEAAIRQAYELFDRYSELSPKNASAEMLMNIMSSEDAGYIADFLAQNVSMRVLDKQSILDELRPVQRLNKMNRLLRREVEILEMEQSIQRRVQENMTQNQKDAFLREQVRVIQEELGEDGDNELAAYRRQIADAKLPEDARIIDAVERVAGEPLNGLCEDEVDLFLLALANHAEEFCALFCGCTGDAFVREDARHRPFFVGHDFIGVVFALRFIAAGLFFLFRGNTAVRCHTKLLCDCSRLL